MTATSAPAASTGDDVDVPTGNTYDKYGSTNPIERWLLDRFLRTLDRFLEGTGAATVLEVGMGEGIVTSRVREVLRPDRLVGIDLPDPDLAADWHDRALVGAFADIVSLPFRDREFDLVLAIEVLEHVPDPVASLGELRRVAADAVILSVPREPIWRAANMARGKYLRALGNTPGHVQHWSKRGFAAQVTPQLDIIEVAAPFPWTMVNARVTPRS